MSKKIREEIKKLQSMQSTVEAEIEALKMTEQNLKQELAAKRMSLNKLKQRIHNLSKNNGEGITISEHAIIRYFERILGLNMEEVTQKILPDKEAVLVESLGNGHYPINGGEFKIIVRNDTVVTLYTDETKMD